MSLPLTPPVAPILAKPRASLPDGDGWVFEPKWDGFRAIVFKVGDEVVIGSRNAQPLTRYFPELVDELAAQLPERCIVDGEIVVDRDGRLDFDALQQRIHPAASRVEMLAAATPASMVIFDLLSDGTDLTGRPLSERRDRLAELCGALVAPLHLTPATTDRDVAMEWFERFEGAGLDGLIAKPLDSTYEFGVRVFAKLKHERTLDAVVCGFRWHKSGPVVGSLLLGLYNDDGTLQYVGACSSFTVKRRAELLDELAPYRDDALGDHPWRDWADAVEQAGGGRMPGAVSRWSGGKDSSWVPVRPELVVEIRYDQFQGPRLRHLGQFRRWRPDRDPRSCGFDQVERPAAIPLSDVLDAGDGEGAGEGRGVGEGEGVGEGLGTGGA